MSHWNILHTTQTPHTFQVGVPLEHTAHHPNPTNWSRGCRTGTNCTPPKPHKLVKRVSHRNTLHTTQTPHTKSVSHLNKPHTTQTPQTGQEGVAQKNTARHPNPTNWPSSFQSAAFTWPVYFSVALASISILPWWGLAIQLLHVGTKHSKANETKLACLTNTPNRPNVLSRYPWKCVCLFTSLEKIKINKRNKNLHAHDSKNRRMWFFKVTTLRYFTSNHTVLREIQYLSICSYILLTEQ